MQKLPVQKLNVRNILQEYHLLLTPDMEHKTFSNVPVVGFHNGKSLKDYLVTAALPKNDESRRCDPCGRKTCLVCNLISKSQLLQQSLQGIFQNFDWYFKF